jgi:hypothetical protein
MPVASRASRSPLVGTRRAVVAEATIRNHDNADDIATSHRDAWTDHKR